MRNTAVFLLLLSGSLGAQTPYSGVVTDSAGRPLDKVAVGPAPSPESGARPAWVQGPGDGTFRGHTFSPRLVFRRRSMEAVVVTPAENLRIRMRPAPPAPFPRCLTGWEPAGSLFGFPAAPETPLTLDVDYGAKAYSIKLGGARHTIRHGFGVLWSEGWPFPEWVQSAIHYDEKTFLSNGVQITTARGLLPGGVIWRFVGRFGETAEYLTTDPEAAAKLDAILDSLCLYFKGTPSQPPR
jgi:hypothetical protein